MDLTRYVDELRHQLATAAAAGGDDARDLADRLTASLDAAARLMLLDALSDAAGEISAELAPGSVDIRLRGGSPEFVVAAPSAPPGPPTAVDQPPAPTSASAADVPASGAADGDRGESVRTTLRLPEQLKAQVETAAARDGVSVNTWLVRAVTVALEQSSGGPTASGRAPQRSGNRVTGWVR
ncbi:toxin-antitoxin system HicB family antitoxin [Cellulosimicrobium marinum]|uniref:toxin-antitoxin system HicB family antitoxin n=1 Tax=Cellulosimicrobium marinum TaxID=1638992 RepID=UPI001E406497|nr:toxin-antitoxin system HicB family antitoxin [Cellulosimicrobium marinum]MCB7135547.1 toxin-antitoxin system HicB family antitoxin [Cellulosimicrobium marinum]